MYIPSPFLSSMTFTKYVLSYLEGGINMDLLGRSHLAFYMLRKYSYANIVSGPFVK